MEQSIKIGLSLSGGGARAIAHIGAIEALHEYGIKADCVAGTSGGAIVAALYAAGLPIEKIKKFSSEGSLFKLIKPGLPNGGLVSLDYLGKLLDKYIGNNDFNQLKRPLAVVATNLVSGKPEILESGDLYKSVMASCAIPLVFEPVEIDGILYVDGGVFDNLPVAPLQPQCDIIIGSNVMPLTEMDIKKLDSMFSVGMRVFDISVSSVTKAGMAACDFLIEPKAVGDYGVFSFSAYKELHQIGYEAALKVVPDILKRVL